ncbi:MAG: hypothetical protein JST92_11910 [Deltaproteobacteria bacterium]|nr:hypothetical protein [Deltaproteobacteria bacterium]
MKNLTLVLLALSVSACHWRGNPWATPPPMNAATKPVVYEFPTRDESGLLGPTHANGDGRLTFVAMTPPGCRKLTFQVGIDGQGIDWSDRPIAVALFEGSNTPKRVRELEGAVERVTFELPSDSTGYIEIKSSLKQTVTVRIKPIAPCIVSPTSPT